MIQIAAQMGWSLRHAANVIEQYASVARVDADNVLDLLARAKTDSGAKLKTAL